MDMFIFGITLFLLLAATTLLSYYLVSNWRSNPKSLMWISANLVAIVIFSMYIQYTLVWIYVLIRHKRKPTKEMIEYAYEISEKRNERLSVDVLTDFIACRAYLNQHSHRSIVVGK